LISSNKIGVCFRFSLSIKSFNLFISFCLLTNYFLNSSPILVDLSFLAYSNLFGIKEFVVVVVKKHLQPAAASYLSTVLIAETFVIMTEHVYFVLS
jgi:hypothetical protein